MAVLHLLANPAAASACVAAAGPGDAVLLLGDGIFAAARLTTELRVGALQEDAAQRGEGLQRAEALTDADFVDWVIGHDHSVTWT